MVLKHVHHLLYTYWSDQHLSLQSNNILLMKDPDTHSNNYSKMPLIMKARPIIYSLNYPNVWTSIVCTMLCSQMERANIWTSVPPFSTSSFRRRNVTYGTTTMRQPTQLLHMFSRSNDPILNSSAVVVTRECPQNEVHQGNSNHRCGHYDIHSASHILRQPSLDCYQALDKAPCFRPSRSPEVHRRQHLEPYSQ